MELGSTPKSSPWPNYRCQWQKTINVIFF
jgi:hypothetical protein